MNSRYWVQFLLNPLIVGLVERNGSEKREIVEALETDSSVRQIG